ncbi:MAG: S8 family serine peptidase [Bacteroidota bacterium]|nr:S8 family serine peptidase [Bacteroidota bacterium]
MPDIVNIHKDSYPIMDGEPNDPLFYKQWHLKNTVNSKFDIKAVSAWDLSKGDNIKIAIIDAGVRHDHEDLNAHIWFGAGSEIGYDTTTPSGRHGTYVAGVAAAVTNNNKGVAGVAWNGLIMPRIGYTVAERASDIYDAALNGAKVINCSWHYHPHNEDPIYLRNAVRNAFNLGSLIVSSMGNEGISGDIIYPAAYDSFVVACGALLYVNNGDTVYVRPDQNRGTFIDVTAPGDNLWTTAPLKDPTWGYYTPVGMTSFSTPQVAGLAALIMSIGPSITNAQVMGTIKSNATLFSGWETNPTAYGSGMINCYKALKYTIENYSTTLGGAGQTITFNENITTTSGTTLTILPGTTLNIASGFTLTLNGSLSISGAVSIGGAGSIVVFNQNTNIPNGATLSILSGTTIKSTSSLLSIFGKLIAKGTSSQPITFTSSNATPSPGDWESIFLYGGPDTLEYCTIKYAKWGIGAINTNTHFIKNSTIEQCENYGIYCLNTGTSGLRTIVHFSTIRNNPVGIGLNNSRINLYKTRVENNTQCYGGIYSLNSKVYLGYSRIQNNSGPGILVDGSSSWITLSYDGSSSGRDTLNNNAHPEFTNFRGEIRLINNGTAYLGERVRYICGWDCPIEIQSVNTSECWPIYCTRDNAGYNNIYNSFTFSGRLVNNQTASTVKAQLNYWGSCPPGPNGFIGSVDRSLYFCSMQKYSPLASKPPEESDLDGISFNPPPDRDIWYVRHLIKQIKENPNASLNELHLLSTKIQPNEILPDSLTTTWQTYLSMLQTRSPSTRMRSLAAAYRIQAKMDLQEYNSAVNIANAILSLNPGDEMWMYCNVQKVNAYIAIGDTANARSIYTAMGTRGQTISAAAMEMLASSLELGILLRSSSISIGDTLSPEQAIVVELPKDYHLFQNYPNPFNPVTRIEYSLPVDAQVTLKIYDILGREVATLVNEIQDAGFKSVEWDASGMGSGIFFYKLTAGASTGSAYTEVKKMVLMQ